jgi:hypothetical protein
MPTTRELIESLRDGFMNLEYADEVRFCELRIDSVLGSSAKVDAQEPMRVASKSSPRVPRIEKYSDQRSPSS